MQKIKTTSQEDVMQKMENIFESKVLESLISYMQNVKNNRIDPEKLDKKIQHYSDELSDRSKAFLEMGSLFRRIVHHEKIKRKF